MEKRPRPQARREVGRRRVTQPSAELAAQVESRYNEIMADRTPPVKQNRCVRPVRYPKKPLPLWPFPAF
jgi:hypothetical protein